MDNICLNHYDFVEGGGGRFNHKLLRILFDMKLQIRKLLEIQVVFIPEFQVALVKIRTLREKLPRDSTPSSKMPKATPKQGILQASN